MSNLISLDNVSLTFNVTILDQIKLQIAAGERICLIGRNGEGKSTLLKVIEGTQAIDKGNIWRKPGLRIARLEQELPQHATGTIFEYVAQGLAETGRLLSKYHTLTQALTVNHTDDDLLQLESLQHQIDAVEGWKFEQVIKTVLDRLNLNSDQLVSELSGGWQRRVALAKALVASPELLLLDEPTNHLDISAIEWLEDFLMSSKEGLLFITHDRSLLQRLATRIIELDRGILTSWPGDYTNFLRRKEEMLHAESKQNQEFDKRLAQEERWIRQGIKARRTRNEGRVRKLKSMRVLRAERRELQGQAVISLNEAEKSGQLVIEANHISQVYHDQPIIKDFSIRVMRGDRIGLIGPNGIGKSTLLNILLCKIKPTEGTVKLGSNLQIAYFDQLRLTLDFEKSVIDNISYGCEEIEINGKKRHIMSYLSDFLFTPARARMPVKSLSGGECSRLLLARLFSKSFNLLVLDEPTNDLDMETLELLEELLGNYQGTLLLVSHDRTFLENVVTSTVVFEGGGIVREYIGGYQDWLRQKNLINQRNLNNIEKESESKISKEKSPLKQPIEDESKQGKVQVSRVSKKLSYKEQRELAELPASIEKMEQKQHELQTLISDPTFYQNSHEIVSQTMTQLNELELEIARAYQRWDELEKK